MSLRERYSKLVTELIHDSEHAGHATGSLLTDEHVQHLSMTADQFLRTYSSFRTVAIALPHLVFDKWYHCVYVSIGDGRVFYHSAVEASSSFSEIDGGPCRYSKRAAMDYAAEMWGNDLLDSAGKRYMPLAYKSTNKHTEGTREPRGLDTTNAAEDEGESVVHIAIEKQIQRLGKARLRMIPGARL
jgi:hypothetical protein